MEKLLPLALERCVANGADVIVATGDLVEMPVRRNEMPYGYVDPSPDDYREAALADYRWIRSQLENTGLPYIVLPGNHDCDALLGEVFADQQDERMIGGLRFVRFTDREWRNNIPRRFDPQRQLFNKVLADDDPTPQVHLQHYVITPEMNAGWPHTYGDAGQMLAAIVNSKRVALALSGHYHRGCQPLAVGGTTFVTTPALCESPFQWAEYTIEDGKFSGATVQQLGADVLPRRKVVFLDRDGVINTRPMYRAGVEAMELIDGAAEAIRQINRLDRMVVVVSSQTGIGMGAYPPEVVNATNDRMCELLAAEGATIDAISYSVGAGKLGVLPQYVDTSANKPSPSQFLNAAAELNLDLSDGWFVGDNISDVQAALNCGVQPALVRTGHGAGTEKKHRGQYPGLRVFDDLKAFVETCL